MTATLSVILICLLLSAFFSGMEIAFLTSNKLRIEIDKSKKGVTQALIDLFISHSGMYITTLLVGNNVVMVIYGIFMFDLLVKQFEFLHLSIGVELFVETLVSTLIILVFAEFLPKTVFRLRSNLFLKLFSVPVFLFYLLFFPLSYFSVWLGGWLLRIFTGRKLGHKEPNRAFGKVDLNNLIEEGEVNARQEEEMHEIKLFRNALDFSEVKLRECIVPRPDVVALSIDSSIEELTQLFIDTGLSRILIYKESIDDIIGYVHISTLFKDPPTIAKALSRVLIVPETMSAQRLLNLFIRDQKSVAVVVDEFGITAGIVTIEDIMEEIFGEIEDEHDHLNLKEVMISEQEYIFSGRLEVDYLNEKYHLDLEEREEYETLAGLVLYFNQSIPQEGETIVVNDLTFKILSVKNARIEEIKVCM
nr:hemolysin family protein [Odoribacter splanchnicus]